ncbi:TRAP transporter small permease subunit [Fodinicurvata halophila]|uniref:TRAP transporter small permease protein n=1 Tax=Fodinicurvata halophila TaxID=1419723 RepID=A0ABV8UHL0_9PROT
MKSDDSPAPGHGPSLGPSSGPTGLVRVDRVVHQVEKLFAYVSAGFIFALMLLGVAQIAGRKLLNTPIFGYIDMVELAMTTFAFLAVAYCERLGGHVRMDMIIDNLHGRLRWAFEVFGILCGLFLIAVLIYYGFDHALRAYNYGDSTIDAQYPWWPSKLLVPLSFSLLWIRLAINLIGYGRLLVHPDREAVAVPVTLSSAAVDSAEYLKEADAPDDNEQTGRGR